jgi:hypothetical protein
MVALKKLLPTAAILGAAAASAYGQDTRDEPDIPSKHRIGYSHSFLDYESKLGDGQGQRDTLDLRLNLTDDLRLDALYSRTRYSGKSRLLCDGSSGSTGPFDGSDGEDGDDGCGDDYTFDTHPHQRGRGHHSHGHGHGYGHHRGHGHCGCTGNPGMPGTPGTPGTGMLDGGCGRHTDIENYLELGLTADLGGFRLGGGLLYDDNLDARHLFVPWHVEGIGGKLSAEFDLSDDTALGLELRLMDLDPGGTNARLAAALRHALGKDTWLTGELYGRRDDLRDSREYGLLLALEHAASRDVSVRLGGKLGHEDFHARSPYEDTLTGGFTVGLRGRLCEGVTADILFDYDAGAVDEQRALVGINFNW